MSEACSSMQPLRDPEMAAQDRRIAERLGGIRHKILVMSGKGGVGKSTVATNLAAALARAGSRVGLLDVDLHGPSVPVLLGVVGRVPKVTGQGIEPIDCGPNLKMVSMGNLLDHPDRAVIWRGPLKIGAIRQFIGDVEWGELDCLVIDCPPGTGDEPLTVAQTIPDAWALVVTTPQEVSLADVRKSIQFCRQVHLPILGILENMAGYVCPHCGHEEALFGQGGGEATARQAGLPFLGRIPVDPRLVGAGDQGRPFLDEAPESPAARVFLSVVADIRKRLENAAAPYDPEATDG